MSSARLSRSTESNSENEEWIAERDPLRWLGSILFVPFVSFCESGSTMAATCYLPVAPARRRVRVDTRFTRVALRRGVRVEEWVRSDRGTKTRYWTRPQAVRTKRLKEDAMFMPEWTE